MTKVFLREKKLKHGKIGLYLDFYPPIIHPEKGKATRREHLRLSIYAKPKTEEERNYNKETKMLAEGVRSQRQLEIQADDYGFFSIRNKQKDFLEYFRQFVEGKKEHTSKSNYENWLSVCKHFETAVKGICRFGDITEKYCNDFKDYLLSHKKLSQNTASSYFDKFKIVVRQAFEDKLLQENPTSKIKSIKLEDTEREFLTYEELQLLAETPFKYEDLRRASLFSALTGLRYSDIEKLKWKDIQHSNELGYFIRFRQKKTKDLETLQISDDALTLLGERNTEDEEINIFENLQYWQCSRLPNWTSAAGIKKEITFHCFRHTFATLQMTLGTDIYTVSKLLGHKNIQTTQIYAKVIDQKKREAVNKIKLKGLK